ncbi:MAG: DNA polymerase Y family protein [Acetobacteraceae bacterium]|nr:DNA polymerase Y family protein [Acetobacteraceae bacterium]
MRRVVSIWLPHWPTDRRRKARGTDAKAGAPPRDVPLITAWQDGNRRVIEAVDPAAAAAGLRPAMAVAHAMAVVPNLHVLEADPADDEAALERLARWCQRVTPLAAPDTPDGIWLDMTGCAHFWGGEQALLDDLVARLAQDGITARAAIADTPGAAHALARHGGAPTHIVPPGAQADTIAPLPVAALRLPDDMVATLRRLGFEQVEALARVPRALITRRFGPLPGRRLDQAQGRVPEPLQPLAHETPLQHRIAFLEPLLTADALGAATACLLDPVCAAMERAHLGARRVDLLFERVDGAVLATRIGTARANRDPRHLARLLDEHLETVDPGLGIDAMRLVVPLAETLRWQQDDTGNSTDVSALVDRLANRLGADRVYRVAPVESDVPERAVRRIPALARAGAATWFGGDAPTRLFHPPRPIDALAGLPDHAPAAFTWRRRRHHIRRADGPERIYGEWWRRDAEFSAVRDYFRVEDEDGSRFLLFRQGDGVDLRTGGLSWYLQGIF